MGKLTHDLDIQAEAKQLRALTDELHSLFKTGEYTHAMCVAAMGLAIGEAIPEGNRKQARFEQVMSDLRYWIAKATFSEGATK